MVTFEIDGTVSFVDPSDPTRVSIISAGYTEESLKTAFDAFFGATPWTPVPPEISMMQARLLLDATPSPSGVAGRKLLDDVDDAVAAAPRSVQIYWQFTSVLHRDHQILAQLTGALGLTSAQVDDLFRQAILIT